MSQPGQWKRGDVALFKPPFGCAHAGRWLGVTLREGGLQGALRPHGCAVPGCRVWPQAETAEAGVYRNVPECELAEVASGKGEAEDKRDGTVRAADHDRAKWHARTRPPHARLPYSDDDP